MRRFVLSCLVNTVVAYPSFLVGSNCAEPIAIANGQSPGFGGMGGSYAGTALNIASLTDGGTLRQQAGTRVLLRQDGAGDGEAVHKGEGDEELLRELQPAVPRRRLPDQPGHRMSERQTCDV